MATIQWASGVSGHWETAADWSGGTVPGAGDDVIIDAPGTYGVTIKTREAADSLTINDAKATVFCKNPLTIGGTLTVAAGKFDVDGNSPVSGGIIGGTLRATGGEFLWNGGFLSGVTYEGTLDLSAPSALIISDGLKVTGADGTGPGVINLTGAGSTLYIGDTETLDNATLNIGGAGGDSFGFEESPNSLLTLGDHFNIVQVGPSARIIDGFANSQGIVNDGAITAAFANGVLQIAQVNFTNNGSIAIGNGATFDIESTLAKVPRTFTNSAGGAITVGNGSTLTAEGTIANAGSIALESAGSRTELILEADTTFAGGGSVTLSANAANRIVGARASYVLTNTDNTISGSGALGGGMLTLVNAAGGIIDAEGKPGLAINTGSNTISNAGLIETTERGAGTIASPVDNTGTIEVDGGALTLKAVVSGSGTVAIAAGTLDIANANAAEAVGFTGKGGELELAQSQSFTGSVSGFAMTGRTSLDLRDIGFVSPGEASYNGATGILTVTDGIHTANIALVGNYGGTIFTAGSDKHGGTSIVDKAASGATLAAPATTAAGHRFIAAMAGVSAVSASPVHTVAETWRASASVLATPRVNIA